MDHTCRDHMQVAIDLSEKMIDLANDVAKNCEDDDALVVFSVVRDSAHRIKQMAEQLYEETDSNY